ncbi:MAG: putative polymerase sigma subunit, family [Clostridia bacterium]|jgi:RNA polymerase sigma-70 factor (ECF subfamily)|nr:putative polymerase sigma subunit, family [Clostridia bacterium]
MEPGLNTRNLIAELEEVFYKQYKKLYACAYRLTGSHENAEDVLQNSFLKAYKNIAKFNGKSKLYTWLYRIVINESYRFFEYIDKLPVTRITENLGQSEEEFFHSMEYLPDYDDNLIMDEMREKCLHAFLKCLPKNQRVCFLLKTCMELKNQEIAEVLGLSIENVKVILHRGKKRLQELFEMRCSLIDPKKPCKCYLWIKFMRDHHLEMPKGYGQERTEELKEEHFRQLSSLKKINYLYTVQAKWTKDEFIYNLKKVVESM